MADSPSTPTSGLPASFVALDKELRGFTDEDAQRVICRHTALEPLLVQERHNGQVVVYSARCGNCGMVLQRSPNQ
jgi:hypothetical protein